MTAPRSRESSETTISKSVNVCASALSIASASRAAGRSDARMLTETAGDVLSVGALELALMGRS
jgi:hypothetical protein